MDSDFVFRCPVVPSAKFEAPSLFRSSAWHARLGGGSAKLATLIYLLQNFHFWDSCHQRLISCARMHVLKGGRIDKWQVIHLGNKINDAWIVRVGTWLYFEVEPWRILFLAERLVWVLVVAEGQSK
jgi:hypothetical protein